MANSNFELIGKVEAKPEFVTLADGSKVEVHTFEAHIKDFESTQKFTTGPSAAAMWLAQETQRR